MPIAALVTMYPKAGRIDELEARLVDILADVRTEPGNLAAIALRDPDNPDLLYEFAIYRDQQAVEDHRQADHSLTKGPVVKALFDRPMEVRLFETLGVDQGADGRIETAGRQIRKNPDKWIDFVRTS